MSLKRIGALTTFQLRKQYTSGGGLVLLAPVSGALGIITLW
jgi:hypothetical protein